MKELNETQIYRINDFFKRKSKIRTSDTPNGTVTIKAFFTKNILKTIVITINKQINIFGRINCVDTYTYTLENKQLVGEHVPNNPHKEMQEKYILEVIEELMRTVQDISNTP
jgi:hypothetical protein